MNKKLRGASIGAGKMGLLHGAIINSMPSAELVSICEPSKLIQNTIKEFSSGINIYSDYEKMLKDEDLDFVFITTPSYMHVEMAMKCIENNCHFFIEKPLSTNGAEAKPLIDKLNGSDLLSMVGYMMRYIATFKKVKEILDSEIIGKLINFNSSMYVSQLFKTGKGWRYNKDKSGGGVIITQATHIIDLITWYFGFPNRLNASLISPYSKNTEDFGHITFNWDNGLMGWLDSSWSVHNHRILETTIKINGHNGSIFVNDDTIKLFLVKQNKNFSKGWTIIRKPEIETGVIIDIGGPHYTRQDEKFINAIINNHKIDNDVFSAYKVQKIVDNIYISNKRKNSLEEINYE